MRSLLILTVSAVLFAQTATRSNDSKKTEETLSIGTVELHLGMAEDVVLAKLAKAGYKVSGIAGSDEWVVAEQTDRFPFQPLGDVSFKNKTLVFINRTWTPDADTAANIGEGLYGVMSNLSKNGRKQCSLVTDERQSPTAAQKDILSGRTMARTGLRMMPSPSSPLSFRTAGFPQYGWKAGLSGGACPSTTSSSRRAVCLHPSWTSLPVSPYPRSEPRGAVRYSTTVQAA